MSLSASRRQHLFVVRTWQESNNVAPVDQWRGSVEHVLTGQRVYFARIEDLNRFLLEHMQEGLDDNSVAQLRHMFPPDLHPPGSDG